MAVVRITDEAKRPFDEVARDGEMSSLDEFIVTGADIHVERMDDGHIWIGVSADGRRWHLNFKADHKRRLRARLTDEGPI